MILVHLNLDSFVSEDWNLQHAWNFTCLLPALWAISAVARKVYANSFIVVYFDFKYHFVYVPY